MTTLCTYVHTHAGAAVGAAAVTDAVSALYVDPTGPYPELVADGRAQEVAVILTDDEIRRLPFGRRPTVHVCMRDHQNAPEERLWAVRICDKLGDLVISLQTDDLDEGYPASLQTQPSAEGRQWLHVDGASFGGCFPLGDFRHYVGNILWDAGTMGCGDARLLVRTLLRCGFHVDEVVEVDP